MKESDGISVEGGISTRLVAVAAALKGLESLAELLAAVELLAARCGRDMSPGSSAAYALRDALVKCLFAYRATFWEVPRLKIPDLSHTDGLPGNPALSDQLASALPSVQAVVSPEVAMEIVAELERLSVRRLREGGWNPLWYDVRLRLQSALVGDVSQAVFVSTAPGDLGRIPDLEAVSCGGDAPIAAAVNPVFTAETACSHRLYVEGKASPRTCRVCGLGPCRDADYRRKDLEGEAA